MIQRGHFWVLMFLMTRHSLRFLNSQLSGMYSVTELKLSCVDPAWAIAWPRLSASAGRVLFLFGFKQPNNKSKAEINTAQALFSGQRMEKLELSSQVNFSSSR